MRAVRRKRPQPRDIHVLPTVDLDLVAGLAVYVGSPEHRMFHVLRVSPRLRAHASCCPRNVADKAEILEWLRSAIRRGATGGPWEGDFPRYVWYKHDDTVFEGRLVNRGTGDYKGYPLDRDEWPEGIEALYADA